MALTKEKISSLEQWHLFASLSGVTEEDLIDMSYYDEFDDDDDILGIVYQYLCLQKHIEKLPTALNLARSAQDLGISADDLLNFGEYIDERRDEQERLEKQERVKNNPAIQKIRKEHNFQSVPAKSTAKKTMVKYEFDMPDGTRVGISLEAEIYYSHTVQTHITWKDRNNTSHKQAVYINGHICPGEFPQQDLEWVPETVALCIAHTLIRLSTRGGYNRFKLEIPRQTPKKAKKKSS